MSKRCQITGKKTSIGNNVSHAHNKTKKRWKTNLQTKKLYNPETGKWHKIKLSARAMRIISRKGVNATLRKYQRDDGII